MSPGNGKGRPRQESGPSPISSSTDTIPQPADSLREQLRRRRDAAGRLPTLPGCGHRDPLAHLLDPGAGSDLDPGTRRAVLRLAARYEMQTWEIAALLGGPVVTR